MRIVLDLQACQASSKHRGIGRYSIALAQAMARNAGRHELLIALSSQFPDAIAPLRADFDGLVGPGQFRVFDLPGPLAEYDARNAWRVRAAERLREHFLAGLAPDAVHVASLFEGLSENACASVAHGDGSFASAVTLYDLIPLTRKDVYLAEPTAARWYYRKLQSLKNADLLLAISAYSRQDGIATLQVPAERVVNISSAVGPEFYRRTLDADARAALYQRLGLRGDFIMYTGGIDYRKNIEGLIEAYARLPQPLRASHQLAVVCSIRDEDRARLQRVAAQQGLAPGQLVLTGFVSDDDLVALYSCTALFVFPSLLEGFGLPALEAMSCGAPTIGSDSSSIPEVIGRADALFDPTDIGDITAKMAHVLGDPAFDASLRAHGLEQAKLFSWDASAKVALAAFEATHERTRARAPSVAVGGRPRLAFVSPLPPERSGIADYSAELLPELARYYDIDLIVEQDQVSDSWAAANFTQRTAAWFDQNAHRYERIVYQVGNSAFHQHMFALLERHPGVVVMHDFYMSGIMHHAAGASAHPNNYQRVLYESHGYRALAEERAHGLEQSIFTYPCNKVLVEHALGMVVHSEYSRTLAERWYGPGTAADWAVIPLLRWLPGARERAAARQALGLGEDDFLVCSFGHLDVTKCNERIVEAWLGGALGAERACHLVFVGQNNAQHWGHQLLARIAGNPRIRITGFVAQETYRQYLTAADAAIQLRKRSRGETSAAIYDCLAYQLPTIINAHGTAAEVPAEVCVKLDDRFTDAALAEAMLALHRDGAARAALGQRAGAYMQEVHHPARVGAMYRGAFEGFYQRGAGIGYRRLLASLGAIATTGGPDEADLAATAACIAANRPQRGLAQLLVDVSDTLDGAEQALLRRLLENPPPGCRTEPVRREDGQYRYARAFTLGLIGRPELVLDDSPADIRPGDRLLLLGAAEADPLLAARGVIIETAAAYLDAAAHAA